MRRPIEYVTWEDCQIFINRLNELTGVDTLGMTFRLPTEAEWEYAARGGNASRGYNYSGSDNANDVAWYDNNSSLTKIVKSKRANELGIYDMSGNVWEWCADWYDESYYHNSPQDNPTGPENGVDRVIRGGSWGYGEWNCRVNNRNFYSPNGKSYGIGLRLVLVPIEEVN